MTLTRHLTGRMAIGLLVTIACLLAFAVPVTADGGMKITPLAVPPVLAPET